MLHLRGNYPFSHCTGLHFLSTPAQPRRGLISERFVRMGWKSILYTKYTGSRIAGPNQHHGTPSCGRFRDVSSASSKASHVSWRLWKAYQPRRTDSSGEAISPSYERRGTKPARQSEAARAYRVLYGMRWWALPRKLIIDDPKPAGESGWRRQPPFNHTDG